MLKLGTVLLEEAALHAEETTKAPAARDDSVRQQKLELAYRSQLGAQTLSKVHEVRFPLALNKRLTG
jgi:hypothetical protein